jgi:2-hydroxycyclohexanecarboxyl-CoA dehydrogenase
VSRVAVVTGGASGIGFGIVARLAAAGHRVALVDLEPDAVARAADELKVVGRAADVSDRVAVDAALAAIRAELGPIEIMVTSAGINVAGPFLELEVASWERALAVNLTGTFHCIQSAVPDMLAGGWGRIVTISSSSAQSGAPDRAAYVASKGGVIALTKALAVDLSPHGITANTIPPSIVDTPMSQAGVLAGEVPPMDVLADFVPVRRVSTPDDIAAACEFLCSDDAGFITGQVIGVNGGMYM